ncbi:MAG: PQQ-binding-like beta-propeller repeat protein [Phycisphaerae bacterium]|nr:PQQ-binding-like beta-propeller repeat protein [Phycisphaerae bacterium]
MRTTRGLLAAIGFLTLAGCTAAGGGAVGWRMDGTGRFPAAHPVTQWAAPSATQPEGKNILWATTMPAWGNASPALIGDRIFVCSEPDELVCVNKAEGKVLWRRSVKLSDVWTDADRAVAADKLKLSDELKKKYQELDDDINATWEAKTKDPNNQALKDKFKRLRTEQAQVLMDISKLTQWAPAKTESTNGYTSATPRTDGTHVWVVMGTGMAACFDMVGQRKWVKFIERPKHQEGHAQSPVLFDGKLLIQITNLRAVDPLTGETIWQTEGLPRSWGTPFPTRVGGVPVVVTARGKIVRMSDGKIVAGGAGSLDYASPLVADGVAYFIENGGQATRLSPGPRRTVTTQKEWTTTPEKNRYYGSPVLEGGLIYTMHQANRFSVINAANGKVIKSEKLDLGKGDAYTSVTLAGGLLFVGNESGRMAVIQPGRDFKVLAVNTLDRFRTTPIFEGGRMYLRTAKYLYCIGQPRS